MHRKRILVTLLCLCLCFENANLIGCLQYKFTVYLTRECRGKGAIDSRWVRGLFQSPLLGQKHLQLHFLCHLLRNQYTSMLKTCWLAFCLEMIRALTKSSCHHMLSWQVRYRSSSKTISPSWSKHWMLSYEVMRGLALHLFHDSRSVVPMWQYSSFSD